MTSSKVEMEKREEQKLKHLGFMRVMATNSIVLVLNLYNFAKNNSGPLKSTVGTVEIAVSTVFCPFYERFKGLPDDVLIFVDNKVDDATNKFDKFAPPLAKKAVRSVHAIVEKVSNPAKHFVHFVGEAQARGPKAAISHAGALSKHVAMSFAVSKLALAWYKIDHQPTLHGFASIALPTAAHFSEKYNMIIVELTAKGYPIFGFLPVVPVEDIVKAYKQVKAGVAKEENTTSLSGSSDSD